MTLFTLYSKTSSLLEQAYDILIFSLVTFTVTIVLVQIFSSFPIKRLGVRPNGSGLWTYLFSQLFANQSFIWGYDSSLGAVSPIFRVIFHTVAILILWSISVGICSWYYTLVDISAIRDDGSHLTVLIGITITTLYISSLWIYWAFSPGVSHPGGPRSNENKIRRMPQWDNIFSTLGKEYNNWACSVADKSHAITHKRFEQALNKTKESSSSSSSSSVELSGEPFGRQIWYYRGKENHHNDMISSDIQLRIVKIASGGRPSDDSSRISSIVGTFNPSINPNSADIPFRTQMIQNYVANGGTLPDENNKPRNAMDAARKGIHFYSMLQTEDGHWAGDYGGPHFLMPGLIIAWYVMGKPSLMLDQDQCDLMKHYFMVHQQSDGGWGTHIESPSTMFGTVMCYVALRLLGTDPNVPFMQRGRSFIQNEGGAIMTSSWAKFWLCLLGCMSWDGHNSVPPEMWLLPNYFPFHPSRLWCHCRMVYLPMGYLYGVRFVYDQASVDPIILALRKELYCEDYNSIHWLSTRHLVAPMDNYSPIPRFMKFAQNLLAVYETWSIFQPFKNFVRKRGLQFCTEYMTAEDLQTNFIDIGPVNKALNMVSAFHAFGRNLAHGHVINHMMRVPDYLWVAEDGMKMQGYNGSQCWDTAFAIQAIAECKLLDEFPVLSKKVWSYLERTQILSTDVSQSTQAFAYESVRNRDRYYRHLSKGGWPFSTSAHGWPISDCTGEGLKGVLALLKSSAIKDGIARNSLRNIAESRMHDAVDVILTLQNEDGGWATYENNRGFGWYEQLNPSEVFGDIMIDYSYVECSMASLTALVEFRRFSPSHRTNDIDFAIFRGRNFIKSIQRHDGSWYGSWACCFCYGCWFGIEGLIKAGEPKSSKSIQKCCTFLLSHQRVNGGWGEDFTSCYNKDYAKDGMKSYGDDGSGVVNTAWALLALAEAECTDLEAIGKGVRYLMRRQLPCGDWPQEGISGVFNRACGITYTAYRNIFPIWALGRCSEVYGSSLFTYE